ncbi:MAG TPA: winged helix-turn-helix domain-containing protein [Vicinamibacterales bacterium]
MDRPPKPTIIRFGVFELDLEAERLSKNGRAVRLQPQPFKLLCLLAAQSGKLVTREEIQGTLWKGDTFVDFEQGVNFAIKQVRDALGEDAEHPIYIQTVPRRGYRFLAPVSTVSPQAEVPLESDTDELQKALWTNVSELRLAEVQRQKRRRVLVPLVIVVGVALVILFGVRGC